MTIKIKDLFESAWKAYGKKVKKRPRLAAKMKAIMEADDIGVMDDDADDMEAVPQEADDALRGGFEASCAAVVQKALDGDMEPKDALSKLKDMLTAHAKLRDGDDEVEDDLEEEEDPDKKDDNKDGKKGGAADAGDKMTEEQRNELAFLRRQAKARDLCDDAGIVADKVLMEALCSLPESAQKRLVEREKKGRGAAPKGGARSGDNGGDAGGSHGGAKRVEGIDSPEGVYAALLG